MPFFRIPVTFFTIYPKLGAISYKKFATFSHTRYKCGGHLAFLPVIGIKHISLLLAENVAN